MGFRLFAVTTVQVPILVPTRRRDDRSDLDGDRREPPYIGGTGRSRAHRRCSPVASWRRERKGWTPRPRRSRPAVRVPTRYTPEFLQTTVPWLICIPHKAYYRTEKTVMWDQSRAVRCVASPCNRPSSSPPLVLVFTEVYSYWPTHGVVSRQAVGIATATATAIGSKAPRLWTSGTRCAPRRSLRSLLRCLLRPGSPEDSFHSSSEPPLVHLVHSRRRPDPRPFQSARCGFLGQRRVSEHHPHGVSLTVRTGTAGRSPRRIGQLGPRRDAHADR